MEGNFVWPEQVFPAIGCCRTSWFGRYGRVMDGVFHRVLDRVVSFQPYLDGRVFW